MLAVLVVLLAAGVFPLSLLAGQSLLSNASQVVTFLPVAAVGFLVARHQPRNPIGWLLLACATAPLLSADATLYVWLVYRLGHRLPLGPVAVLLAMTWTILFLTLPLVILLFPDGKLPSLGGGTPPAQHEPADEGQPERPEHREDHHRNR